MTPQQIVGLAVRLFAIWLALLAIEYFLSFAQALMMSDGNQNGSFWWIPFVKIEYLITAALYLVVALLLWFFPMVVAHKLVPRTKFQDALALPAQKVVVVACVVLGLLVIVWRALPVIAHYLSLAAFHVAGGQQVSTMAAASHVSGLVGLIQLLVGLFLVIKAHALSAWIMPAAGDATGEQKAP